MSTLIREGHRISDAGQTIVCEAAHDAHCRTRPDCDTETWDRDGACHEHRDVFDGHEDPNTGHPVTPGHDCWLLGHLNPPGLHDTHDDWAEALDEIRPGAAVDIEFHSPDEGCTWTYAEAEPVQSMGWPDV